MIGSNEVTIDQYVLSSMEACQLKQEHGPHSNTFLRADEYASLCSGPTEFSRYRYNNKPTNRVSKLLPSVESTVPPGLSNTTSTRRRRTGSTNSLNDDDSLILLLIIKNW